MGESPWKFESSRPHQCLFDALLILLFFCFLPHLMPCRPAFAEALAPLSLPSCAPVPVDAAGSPGGSTSAERVPLVLSNVRRDDLLRHALHSVGKDIGSSVEKVIGGTGTVKVGRLHAGCDRAMGIPIMRGDEA